MIFKQQNNSLGSKVVLGENSFQNQYFWDPKFFDLYSILYLQFMSDYNYFWDSNYFIKFSPATGF